MGGAINWNCNCRNKTTEDEVFFPIETRDEQGGYTKSNQINQNAIFTNQIRKEQREEAEGQLNNEINNTLAKDELLIIDPVIHQSDLICSINHFQMDIISDRIIIPNKINSKKDIANDKDGFINKDFKEREKEDSNKTKRAFESHENEETNQYNEDENNILDQAQGKQFTNQSLQIQLPLNDFEKPELDASQSSQSGMSNCNRKKSNELMWKSFEEMRNSNKYFSKCEEDINVSKRLDDETLQKESIAVDNINIMCPAFKGGRDLLYENDYRGMNYLNDDIGMEEDEECNISKYQKNNNVFFADENLIQNDIGNKLNDIETKIMVEFESNKSLEELVHYKSNIDNYHNKSPLDNNEKKQGINDQNNHQDLTTFEDKNRNDEEVKDKEKEIFDTNNEKNEDREEDKYTVKNKEQNNSENIFENIDKQYKLGFSGKQSLYEKSKEKEKEKEKEDENENEKIINIPINNNSQSISDTNKIKMIAKKPSIVSTEKNTEAITKKIQNSDISDNDNGNNDNMPIILIKNKSGNKTKMSKSLEAPEKRIKPEIINEQNKNLSNDKASIKAYSQIDQNDRNSDSKSSFASVKKDNNLNTPKNKHLDNVSIFSSKYSPICHNSLLKLDDNSGHFKQTNNGNISHEASSIKHADEESKSIISHTNQFILMPNYQFDYQPEITLKNNDYKSNGNNNDNIVTDKQDRFHEIVPEKISKISPTNKIYKQHDIDIAILPQQKDQIENVINVNRNDSNKKQIECYYLLQQSAFTLNQTNKKNKNNSNKNSLYKNSNNLIINDNLQMNSNNNNQTKFSIEKTNHGIDFLCQSTSIVDHSNINSKRYESYCTSTVQEEQFTLFNIQQQNPISQSVLQGVSNSKEYSIHNISANFLSTQSKNRAYLNQSHQIIPNYKVKKCKGTPNISIFKPKKGKFYGDIIFHSYLKKISLEKVQSYNPANTKYVHRFCLLTDKELKCFISKEQFITLQKPFYVISFNQIEKVELVKLPKTKSYDAFSLTINIDSKETHQPIEDIIFFQAEKEAIAEKWVSTIQYCLQINNN